MAWVRVDDAFSEHPKINRVGAFGAWLQIQALCYANRNLTDGFIPFGVARGLMNQGTEYVDADGVTWRLGETSGRRGRDVCEVDWPGVLVAAGLWERVAGGYRIHDYGDYQPSREQVLGERKRAADRQLKRRSNGRSHAVTHGATHGESSSESSPEVTPDVPRESQRSNAGPVPVYNPPTPLESVRVTSRVTSRAASAPSARRRESVPDVPAAQRRDLTHL